MEIKKFKLSELNPATYNPRKELKPGDKEFEKLKKSIEEFGYVELIVVNAANNNTVISGHQRLNVLKYLGVDEVECIVVELDTQKEKALNIAMNKISGEWDNNLLANLLKELDNDGFDVTLTGFDLKEAKDLFGSGSMKNVHEDEFDGEKEALAIDEPKTKQGDLWLLGKHRLVCGDSTKIEYYKSALDNKEADLLVTDPPYNIDYGGTISGNGRDIANDNLSEEDFYQFLLAFYKASEDNLKKGAPLYIFHSTKETVNFVKAMVDAGLKYAQTLVWYKNHFTLGRQDYQHIFEPILYGWKEGSGHYFINDRTQSTVYEDVNLNAKKMSKNELLELLNKIFAEPTTIIHDNKPVRSPEHPTMKPITLCAKLIYNSSHEGETVLDPFGGSGSTLIAADQLNRKCCMLELEPKYCDVIVKRYKEQNPNAEIHHYRNGIEIED